ncbi:MAG: hypothetical protein MJZ89_00505 [Paludibacteraceae bacterium]|nr:hypothetical protein [Paludibacteraceae bacterium]
MKRIYFLLCALVVMTCAHAFEIQSTADFAQTMALRQMARPTHLDKKQSNRFVSAPQAQMSRAINQNYTLNAIGVEAAYWGTYTEDVSDWTLYFLDSNNSFCLYVDMYGNADATHIAGTYTFADESIYEALVIRAAGDTVEITSGTMSISHNDGLLYDFSVTMQDAANNTYTLNQTLEVDAYDYLYYYYGYPSEIELQDGPEIEDPGEPNVPDGLDYDTPDADFQHNYTRAQFDTSYFTQYGIVTVNAYDATTTVGLFFRVDHLDNTIIIPAGTYAVNETLDFGTVWASEGLDGNSIVGSFAGILNGEYISDVWFLVGGTVTVTNNEGRAHIVVDGTNSYGRTISATIEAVAGTAVENVETATSAQKRLMNQQIVIEKDNKLYNLLGNVIE